jgi:hypothetical protein
MLASGVADRPAEFARSKSCFDKPNSCRDCGYAAEKCITVRVSSPIRLQFVGSCAAKPHHREQKARDQNGYFHCTETPGTAGQRVFSEPRPNPDGPTRTGQRVSHSVRSGAPLNFEEDVPTVLRRIQTAPIYKPVQHQRRSSDCTRLPRSVGSL